ncbi:hypothetical protein EJ08DRAFT_661244 [Tothia fuscella]|uniref:Uncharacterized protein n=1 Tax=Tothia fuscella TaxID=1048955 RepID=A0A9P4NQX4_9PEZI|nr:hypothetical protein EJ08DRAFT_661244 [Tothia fuscella]
MAYSAADLAAITGTECSIAPLDTPLPSQVAHTRVIPRPSTIFLVLSPTTSSDYPAPASTQSASVAFIHKQSLVQSLTSAVDLSSTADVNNEVHKDRRSSSTSSDSPFKRRFLKLGPVHNGGEPGISDYVEFDE